MTNSSLQSTASLSHSPSDTAKTNTIIAVGTKLKGDINLDGDIQIYGVVTGDIVVNEGTLRLMRSGHIEGNLTAPHITVDGRVEGVCVSDHLEILENGRLNGIVKGSNFSIKKVAFSLASQKLLKSQWNPRRPKLNPLLRIITKK